MRKTCVQGMGFKIELCNRPATHHATGLAVLDVDLCERHARELGQGWTITLLEDERDDEITALRLKLAEVEKARDGACDLLRNLAHRYERGDSYVDHIKRLRAVGTKP